MCDYNEKTDSNQQPSSSINHCEIVKKSFPRVVFIPYLIELFS